MKTARFILLTGLLALTGGAVPGADSDAPLELHGPKTVVPSVSRLAQKPVSTPRPLEVKKNAPPPRAFAVPKTAPTAIGGPSHNRPGALVPSVKPAGSINGTEFKPKP